MLLGMKKDREKRLPSPRSKRISEKSLKNGLKRLKNSKMMVYKKRLIDHHTWLPLKDLNRFKNIKYTIYGINKIKIYFILCNKNF